MSWTAVRPYFVTQLEAAGFQAWPDGFAFDNIPSNLLDHAYHITLGSFTGVKQNHTDQETSTTATVRIFFKGYSNPGAAIDGAVQESEDLMKACVNVVTRATTTGILNVVFSELTLDPFDASNDNAIMATLIFNVRIILAVGP